MKVAALIACGTLLSGCDTMPSRPESEAVWQLLHAVDAAQTIYRPETKWSGEVGLEALTEELEAGGYTDEDIVEGIPALILHPLN